MGKLQAAFAFGYMLATVLFIFLFFDELLWCLQDRGLADLPKSEQIKFVVLALLICLCVWELYATSFLITATNSKREKQAVALARKWKRKSLLPYFACVAFLASVILGGILFAEAFGFPEKQILNGIIEEGWILIYFVTAILICTPWPILLGRIDAQLAAEFRKDK